MKIFLLISDPVMSQRKYIPEIGKTCEFDGIPNKYLRHLPGRPHVHLTHLFNHCLRFGHFLAPRKEAKVITLPKPDKEPKFSPHICPISLLSTTGKLCEKLILRIQITH
jgi:hypothetical protein